MPPDPPAQGRLQVMALAYIRCWLAEDYWTQARILTALHDCGATTEQVANIFALMGAKLLAEAHGNDTRAAAAHATAVTDDQAARQIRMLRDTR